MRVYSSAANALTYRPWSVSCRESAGRISSLVAEGIIDPIYEPLDPHHRSRTTKTICQMAELLRDKVSFTILEDRDVLLICEEIDAYLIEIKPMPRTEELRKFLELLMPLRESVMRLRKIVLRRRPEWRGRYADLESGFIQTLYAFLQQAGSISGTPTEVEDITKAAGVQQHAGPTMRLPSLQEQLDSARDIQKLAQEYHDNPGSAYDHGLG